MEYILTDTEQGECLLASFTFSAASCAAVDLEESAAWLPGPRPRVSSSGRSRRVIGTPAGRVFPPAAGRLPVLRAGLGPDLRSSAKQCPIPLPGSTAGVAPSAALCSTQFTTQMFSREFLSVWTSTEKPGCILQGPRDVVYRLQKSEFERSRRLQVRL